MNQQFEEFLGIIDNFLGFVFFLFKLSFVMLIPLSIILCIFIVIFWYFIKLIIRFVPHGDPEKINIAFFHPYCNAGGGGERVLWTAIKALQSKYPNVECYVYTGDTDATPQDIIANIRQRFNIDLEKEPKFIYLSFRKCVEAKYYPVFTLLGQSLGSLILGMEALSSFKPDICIDSMGYAFIYPIFHFIGNCKVASYTHYPTISTDMLGRVSDQMEAHNNRAFIANSLILSNIKLAYYNIFAFLYGLAGGCADLVMVNSSWTHGHISSIWGCHNKVVTVYPPCDTDMFSNLPLISDEEKSTKSIVSIGQFRPEKNYPLQLHSFKRLLHMLEAEANNNIKLILIGGVRNQQDRDRIDELKELANDLSISDKIEWKVNAPFKELLCEVQNGTVGLHTMWNEHFGISVVECMAGGLIMVSHDSGGPKLDIIKPYDDQETGFLASTEVEYALAIKNILNMPTAEKEKIQNAARKQAAKFSQDVFEEKFLSLMKSLLK